jgi:serine/threonine protein kinase
MSDINNKCKHRNSLQAGYRLQEFSIHKILGQGGTGITYLAYDNKNERNVAIKEYLPMDMAVREKNASIQPVSGDFGEPYHSGLKRFIREAQILSQFRHPVIVRAMDIFSDNNTAYLVMEYNGGRSLDKILKERTKVTEDKLIEILIPIMDGIEYIHERGYIHRDIKPANILIKENNEPLILDFGSARQSLGGQTGILTTMFSPGYAPFEQYTGKKINQGPWTDIYGLGATLYKSVTGRAPVDAMARGDALLQIDRDNYVSLLDINPVGYSISLLKAIDKALCFRPSQRPLSIAQWRGMFHAAQQGSDNQFPVQSQDVSQPGSGKSALSCLESEVITISV